MRPHSSPPFDPTVASHLEPRSFFEPLLEPPLEPPLEPHLRLRSTPHLTPRLSHLSGWCSGPCSKPHSRPYSAPIRHVVTAPVKRSGPIRARSGPYLSPRLSSILSPFVLHFYQCMFLLFVTKLSPPQYLFFVSCLMTYLLVGDRNTLKHPKHKNVQPKNKK